MGLADLPAIYAENIDRWLPELLEACVGTLKISDVAFVLAVMICLALALCRISRIGPVRGSAIGYIEIARGLPIVVILYTVYFDPPQMFPEINWAFLTAFAAAIVGLGLHGGAILAEVFRAGIEALHKGQMEAALALGMTPAKAMGYIILPQAA